MTNSFIPERSVLTNHRCTSKRLSGPAHLSGRTEPKREMRSSPDVHFEAGPGIQKALRAGRVMGPERRHDQLHVSLFPAKELYDVTRCLESLAIILRCSDFLLLLAQRSWREFELPQQRAGAALAIFASVHQAARAGLSLFSQSLVASCERECLAMRTPLHLLRFISR